MPLIIKSRIISESMAQDILSNWKNSLEQSEINILDCIEEYNVTLRVRIKIKGSNQFINIKGVIQVIPNKNRKQLMLICEHSKTYIYPVVFGVFLGSLALIRFPYYLSILAAIISAFTLNLIFRYKIKTTAQKFLTAIIHESFKRMNESTKS